MKDVAATATFYEEAFGLRLRFLHQSKGFAEMDTGDTLLAFLGEQFVIDQNLMGGLGMRSNSAASDPIGAQIAFVSEHLERDWKHAIAAGCVVVKDIELKPWGQTAGYLRDLNEFIVELASPNPRDE